MVRYIAMVQRMTPFVTGEFYHLYSRGVEKRIIFLDAQDYQHFLYLMYVCNTEKSIKLRDIGKNFDRGETIVDIGAYCLMPNHFHILVHEKVQNGISDYIRKLLTAYSMYFNKKHERTGRLFESVFKSEHIDGDNYLKYLYSYIHLNPAKLRDKNWRENKNRNTNSLLDFVCKYRYSSLLEYLDHKYKILDPEKFPNYFLNPEEHRKELFDWLSFTPQVSPVYTQDSPVGY